MPLGAPPFRPKSRSAYSRHSPSPPPVPPKALAPARQFIDLNSSTGSYDRATGGTVSRRAVLCDVVVENQGGEDTTSLIAQLGETLEPTVLNQNHHKSQRQPQPLTSSYEVDNTSWDPSKREELEHRLSQLTEEMMRTERSYVSRIAALQKYYAGPLRFFAKQGNTVIIPKYHAKTLFGNIDAVLPAAQTFLSDLEELWTTGQASTLLGDLCLRHLKTLKTFEPYGTYIGNQDEAQKIFQELYRNDKSFVQFVDATKQQTTGIGNIGLRELLMEPVQRIPRYTMLWQSMAKCLPPYSEQRSKLLESIDIASRIARCEADEQTVRATVMYCLQRNIDGIPASLFSNHRNFIDSIDAEELLNDAPSGSSRATPRSLRQTTGPGGTPTDVATPPLHCTLFLFDDQLLIAKRPSAFISGRKLTGLDDIAKLVKSGGGLAVKEKDGIKKDRLSFRGAIDILKVTGVDLGAGDFQMIFDGHTSSTPLFPDQSERWIGRPVRNYSTIHPPQPRGHDPQSCKTDKQRFLNNLWAAQALCRTRPRHKKVEPVCRALVSSEDVELPSELLRVKPYWNLWDRSGWTATDRKGKVVVQLTEAEDVPELSLPQEGGPSLVIRLEAMPGAVCKLHAVTNTGNEVLRTATSIGEVNDKIVEAINGCDMFKVRVPRPGNTTPSSSSTLFSKRASRFGTDIARNLWGNSTSSRGGSSDAFGSSSTKTTASSKSRSLEVLNKDKSSDALTISSVSTNAPKTPRSDRSPISPASPISIVDVQSNSGHDAGVMEAEATPLSPIREIKSPQVKSPVPSRSHSPGPGFMGTQPISRVAAMRMQLERKMHDGSQETLTTPGTSPSKQSPARPLPVPAENNIRKRVPVPTLASSVFQQENASSLSRDSSLSSLPGSPSKAGSSLSRTNTLSPRGPRPRGAALRSGYVAPLPPPGDSLVTASSGRTLPAVPGTPSSIANSFLPHSTVASNHGHSALSHSDHTSLQSNTGHSALEPPPVQHVADGSMEELADMSVPQISSPEGPRLDELRRSPQRSPHRAPHRALGLGAPPRPPTDENMPPTERSPSNKRPHDSVHLSPRKRSASGSSSVVACVDSDGRTTSTLGPVPGPRRTSGKVTARHASRSSILSPTRRVSAMSNRVASVASSLYSLTSTIDGRDIVMSDHIDLPSASDSMQHHVTEARKLARRIRMDALTMGKIRPPAAASGSMTRSPSSSGIARSIHTVLNSEVSKADLKDMDDLARHIANAGEKLESNLAAALADTERLRMLARQIDESGAAYEATITTMESQLGRAKEREELLAEQLRRRDLELEEIYNAFNAELDGMYNDMSLPQPDASMKAMREDLQAAKNARNLLDLENKRLKLELEEERLKREQWSQLLHARGLL